MNLYFDESGNTGVDLLNIEQPVFSLASTNLDQEVCQSLVTPLLRKGQIEAKYGKLKRTESGRRALVAFFSSDELNSQSAIFTLIDKRFYLVSQLIDKLIEPILYEDGFDLYEGDGHIALANLWFYTGNVMFPNGRWEELLNRFVHAIRYRSQGEYANFDEHLFSCWETVPQDWRRLAAGLFMARGRLNDLIGVYPNIEVFDPAVDAFISLVNKWMTVDKGTLAIAHDRSKPLRNCEGFLRMLMTPAATRVAGYGKRQIELPLRISDLSFADSSNYPQIQVADLIAGASIDCLLAWSGRRRQLEYHEAMKTTCLEDLFVGGVLPSPDIERANEPQIGQKSIVDGAAEFLKEVGYFNN